MNSPRLSIILVNYNVKFFLEQCIRSIEKSMPAQDYEIIVVDNASIDNSRAYLTNQFPSIKWIQNEDNIGFAAANNIGVHHGKADYILVLNPDTIVEENSLTLALDYLIAHPDIGALGARMIDGSGRFLPESKRGLPTAWASLCKVSGLYKLFPKSAFFNRYYLGQIDQHQLAEVEVLSGAFMLMHKRAFEEAGGFDERYFMYAEDIDLSYQITEQGYKLLYHPEIKIIHFKGESTKRSSFDYNRAFYSSMILFMEKYRNQLYAGWQIFIYRLMIYLLAGVKYVGRNLKSIIEIIPFVGLAYMALALTTKVWANYRYHDPNYYVSAVYLYALPIMALVWALGYRYYDKLKNKSIFGSLSNAFVVGTALIILVYGLMPEQLRFSRAVILIGALSAYISLLSAYLLRSLLKGNGLSSVFRSSHRVLLIGQYSTCATVKHKLQEAATNYEILGFICPEGQPVQQAEVIGTPAQAEELIHFYKPDQVFFSAEDIGFQYVIDLMSKLKNKVAFNLIPKSGEKVISSRDSRSQGQVFSLELHLKINEDQSILIKRLLDLLIGLILLLFYPIGMMIFGWKSTNIKHLLSIIQGNRTFVGCDWRQLNMPVRQSKRAQLDLSDLGVNRNKKRTDLTYYVRNYSPLLDLQIILANLKHLFA